MPSSDPAPSPRLSEIKVRRLSILDALPFLVSALGAACLIFRRESAPAVILTTLILAVIPLRKAWRATSGTALRPALVWGGLSIGLCVLAQIVAFGESSALGRPRSDQWIYLSVLAALAGLLTVLNARTPGGGAWAILMSLLVLVFLLPWLEGAGLARQRDGWDRLRLATPWTYFFAILVFAAITNYLPTRHGPAACVALSGFVLAGLGASRTDWSHQVRGQAWAWVPWCWTLAIFLADFLAKFPPTKPHDALSRVWLWFRDGWGTVWALRTKERFNRTAELASWPIRLDWGGVVSTDGSPSPVLPDEAVATFASLLRRFADSETIRRQTAPELRADLAEPRPRGDYSV